MTTDTITLEAPAKINLSLRVLHKREDGYHELESLMVPIGLADRLTLKRSDGEAGALDFTCSDPEVPVDEGNLVVKALKRLEAVGGPLPGLRVHLEKQIPHGAGLGGGSSDAAAALRGVNDWLGLGLSSAALHEVAAGLGSDVPFFLHQRACWCRGRGECLEPCDCPPPGFPLLLLKPGFPVPTPWAYQQWEKSPELPGVDYGPQRISFPGVGDWEMVNDLERPVFSKHVVLADMKAWLRSRAEVAAALMSGSGSTMMAVLQQDEAVPDLIRAAKAEFGETLWHWQGSTV